jgi:hypothetical protein
MKNWIKKKFHEIRVNFYEKGVIVTMMSLLGDFQKENLVKGTIKPRLHGHWNVVIEENMERGKSEEFTAFILSVYFYYDMFRNEILVEDKIRIREKILKNEHKDDDERVLSMLIYTYLMANTMRLNGKISEDDFFLGLNEIHRSIFKDDDFVLFSEGFSSDADKEKFIATTFTYMHDGKERMKTLMAT